MDDAGGKEGDRGDISNNMSGDMGELGDDAVDLR